MRCKLSPSDTMAMRRLVVDTETPGTEIIVIDSAGKVVDHAVQRFCKELPPALYKIRFIVGDRVVESLVELAPGEGDYHAAIPELPIISAAPLASPNSEWYATARRAKQQSEKVESVIGSGSVLFIFVTADLEPRVPECPASGLTLHKFSGELLFDFGHAEASAGCAACSLEINPGRYLLRARVRYGNPVEQTVVTVSGWQTQIFLRLTYVGVEAPDVQSGPDTQDDQLNGSWELDLSGMGVLLVRTDLPSRPSATDLRWTAAARQALAAGRGQAAPDRGMMRALLGGKFENPMFGIYAGHLLALQEAPNLELLREVYENLLTLIGPHPDVSTLLIPLHDPRARDLQYPEPPTLRASWSLIAGASTQQRDLRPSKSYSERIAGRLWGSGAWLSWRMPPPELEVADESGDLLQRLVLEAVSGKLGPRLDALVASADRQEGLSTAERLLAIYLYSISKRRNLVDGLTADEDRSSFLGACYPFFRVFRDSDIQRETKEAIAGDASPNSFAQFRGLPYSMLITGAALLAKKLGVRAGKSLLEKLTFR